MGKRSLGVDIEQQVGADATADNKARIEAKETETKLNDEAGRDKPQKEGGAEDDIKAQSNPANADTPSKSASAETNTQTKSVSAEAKADNEPISSPELKEGASTSK